MARFRDLVELLARDPAHEIAVQPPGDEAPKRLSIRRLLAGIQAFIDNNGIAAAKARADDAAHRKEWQDRLGVHDSGSSPAPHTAEDNKRLTRLEQLTSGLSLKTHTGWGDVANAAAGAVAAVPLDAFSADPASVALYPFAVREVIPGDATYAVVLRFPSGNNVNAYRLARTGSGTDPLHGVFHGGSFSGGGFDYYFMAGSIELDAGDTLQVQSVQDVPDHTVFGDEVTKLNEHAAEPYAHQDSPVRVDHLGINDPVGRQVYLTREIHHPGTEHIFSFNVGLLTPNLRNALGVEAPGFAGVSVIDLSGNDGPVATADTSALPAVLNATRIAAIFENQHAPFLTVVVNKALSADAPTHLNIAYGDHAPEHTSQRIALTQHGADIVVGGQTYRVMRAGGGALTSYFDNSRASRPPHDPTVWFSLEYPDGFIEADGSLDTGTTEGIGHYECTAPGVWERYFTRRAATDHEVDQPMPVLLGGLAVAGSDGTNWQIGELIVPGPLPFLWTRLPESTSDAGDYLALSGVAITARRAGAVLLSATIRATTRTDGSNRGRVRVEFQRTRSGVTRTYVGSANYARGGLSADAAYVETHAARVIIVEPGDVLTVRGEREGQNVQALLTSGDLEAVWLGAVRTDSPSVKVYRAAGADAQSAPSVAFSPGSALSQVRAILYYRERHESVRPAAAQNISIYRGGATLKGRDAQVTFRAAEGDYVDRSLEVVDSPGTTERVVYGAAVQYEQMTVGDVRDYRDMELVVLDYGAAPAPVQSGPSALGYVRQRTYWRWQEAGIVAAPSLDGLTWASGNFYNLPAHWQESIGAAVPGHALWAGVATADPFGSVSTVVSRIVDGWNIRFYEQASGGASSASYVSGTHHYYALRGADGNFGPRLPIDHPELDLGWTRFVSVGSNFASGSAINLAQPLNLDHWTEMICTIEQAGFGSDELGDHGVYPTNLMPTTFIDRLEPHDATNGQRQNELRISVGGGPGVRAASLALSSQLGTSWERYDGAELGVVLRRAAGAPANSRTIASMYVRPRVGGYAGGGDGLTLNIWLR